MSDDLEYDDETPDPSERTVTLKRSEIRALEKKAKQVDELASKLANFERQETFRVAGLDLADKRAAYFIKGYEGELTPDAVKAAALEAGFLEPPKDEKPPDDAAALERVREATAGAPPMPVGYEQEMASARTPQDVVAVAAKYGRLAEPQ